MILGMYSKTARLWIPLLVGMGVSLSIVADSGLSTPQGSKRPVMFITHASPPLASEFLESRPVASSPEKDLAWSQKGSLDSTVFSLVGNGNKNKKNKHDEGEDGDHDRDSGDRGPASVQMVFGDRDRGIIHEYCLQHHSNLPPGLAKRGGQLPPGLEKHLRRNGQLPPGLQKKMYRFPVELDRRLPPLPNNYMRVFIAGRGLIVDAQFNIIDIIDVFR